MPSSVNAGQRSRVERAGVERVGDEPLVHRRRAADARDASTRCGTSDTCANKQRLERRESLLDHADARRIRLGIAHERQRVDQTVDVDLAVAHAAHERVATEIVELVEIDRPGDQPLQRTLALARR